MTAFLAATLAALLVVGLLTVLWRENRRRFRQALAAVLVLAAVVGGYVWSVTAGLGSRGDPGQVALESLVLEEVAGSYRLRGILRNNDPARAISWLPLQLRVADCSAAGCRDLFDDTRELRLAVPPGGARPFLLVFPHSVRAGGERRYQVTPGTPRVHAAGG